MVGIDKVVLEFLYDAPESRLILSSLIKNSDHMDLRIASRISEELGKNPTTTALLLNNLFRKGLLNKKSIGRITFYEVKQDIDLIPEYFKYYYKRRYFNAKSILTKQLNQLMKDHYVKNFGELAKVVTGSPKKALTEITREELAYYIAKETEEFSNEAEFRVLLTKRVMNIIKLSKLKVDFQDLINEVGIEGISLSVNKNSDYPEWYSKYTRFITFVSYQIREAVVKSIVDEANK